MSIARKPVAARSSALALAAALLLSIPAATVAQDEYGVHEKHVERLTEAQKIAPVGIDGFGDRISYFTGGLSFNNVDISLPGNSGLPVELRRTFAVEDRRELTSGPSVKGHLGGFAEWDLDIPHLSGMFKATVGWQVAGGSPTLRCSQTYAPADQYPFASYDFWNGYSLNVPGGGSEPLLHTPSAKLEEPASGTYPWVTRSFWHFSCKSGIAYGGEGFIGHAPDGRKYHFDKAIIRTAPSVKSGGFPSSVPIFGTMTREMVYLAVTKVEDQFGNYVEYTYTGDKLTRIKAYNSAGIADGREINITWSGSRIQSATASTGTWTYTYASTGNMLTSVTRPDNSQWTYTRTGKLFLRMNEPLEPQDAYVADCPEISDLAGDTIVYGVKHPAGATATFTLSPRRHYRSNVPHYCVKPSTTYEYLQIPNYSDTFTLTSKAITGPGLATMTWSYAYSGGHGLAFASACGTPGSVACPSVRKVTITGSSPINTWEEHEYGILYDINEGQLLKRSIGASASSVLQTTTNTYLTTAEVASQPFPDLVGQNPLMYADQLGNRLRPLKTRVINQQGTNFTRTTTDFDAFGNSESDSVSGTASRTEATEYHNDLANWIVMLPKRRLVNGTEVEKTDYNADALPWKSYRYGLQTQTLLYDTHGSPASATDGNGHTTTLSNWKWGIPQNIQFPIAGQAIAASVDSRGWITQVTDELGYSTTYGYDAMGRVSSITYPPGDSTSWTPTSISFQRNTVDPYSVGTGHWVQTITRGNYRKDTYFDGLWRPVIELEQDTGVASTKRFKGWKHNHAGQVTFTGYPRATATSIASFGSTGVTSAYDALGRPTSVSQTTELGAAVTQYSYLTAFKTRVRNPRLFNTDTTFQAFGEPSTSSPLTITAAVGQPEQQLTTIARNAFGNPTSVVRSGTYSGSSVSATRSYVYDANQRLCKRVEPETGATLIDYDLASNIAWTAEGSTLTTLTCNRASVAASEKIHRSYDDRNRLTLVNFPDTTSDISTTYYADGAVNTTVTGGVTLTYQYNKRRLLTSERLQHGSIDWLIQHGYNGLGDKATLTYPDGHSVGYLPNALGQATQVGSYATGATYHPNGALKGFTYGNSVVHSLTLNARQLPERSRDVYGTDVVMDDIIDYDFNGNVAAITDGVTGSPGNRDMQYDALDRLTRVDATTSYGGVEVFKYDPLDNLREADQGARQFRYNYNTKWQLSTIKNPAGTNLYVFGHDVRGNMTQPNPGDTFTFDRANRMLTGTVGGSSYQYDGLGRRVRETSGGVATWYQYSRDGQLLYADDAKTTRTHVYLYLSGSLVAKRTTPYGGSPSTNYQHTDFLGSLVAASGPGGVVVRREAFTAYGEPADGGWANGHGYTGHQMDGATELVYMQQRYYDPAIGRFISTDPMPSDVENGWNFNRFQYASSNPYKFIDPDGRKRDGRSMEDRVGLTGRVSSRGSIPVKDSGTQVLSFSQGSAGYDDVNTAAIEQSKYYSSEYEKASSGKPKGEVWGLIGSKEGKFHFSEVIQTSTKFRGGLALSDGSRAVAVTHTHPDGGSGFSGLDYQTARLITFFVRTRDGNMYRWDPRQAQEFHNSLENLKRFSVSPRSTHEETIPQDSGGYYSVCPGGKPCL